MFRIAHGRLDTLLGIKIGSLLQQHNGQGLGGQMEDTFYDKERWHFLAMFFVMNDSAP